MYVLLGLCVGVASATPLLLALRETRRENSSMGMASLLACALLPFLVLQVVLIALWLLRPSAITGFGVSAVLAFLVAVTLGVLKTWL